MMHPDYLQIRQSLLGTLSFLASRDEQIAFAAQVHYDAYQDEFACWWLDSYVPSEAVSSGMFTAEQAEILTDFHERLDALSARIENIKMSIEQLQQSPEWRQIVLSARVALAGLESVA